MGVVDFTILLIKLLCNILDSVILITTLNVLAQWRILLYMKNLVEINYKTSNNYC